MTCRIALCLLLISASVTTLYAQEVAPLAAPQLDRNSWVLIEIWPTVESITFGAYFLSPLHDANRSTCEAVKRALDREQADRGRERGEELNSFRFCMSVAQARAEEYIRSSEPTVAGARDP